MRHTPYLRIKWLPRINGRSLFVFDLPNGDSYGALWIGKFGVMFGLDER